MLEVVETLGDFEHTSDWDLYLEIVTIDKTYSGLYYQDFSIIKDDPTKVLVHVDDKDHTDYLLTIEDDEDIIHEIPAADIVSIQLFS